MWEELGSNMRWGIDYPEWGFSWFSSVPLSNCHDITIRLWLLPSKSFIIHYLLTIVLFDASMVWDAGGTVNIIWNAEEEQPVAAFGEAVGGYDMVWQNLMSFPVEGASMQLPIQLERQLLSVRWCWWYTTWFPVDNASCFSCQTC
jgi:hypothetical protein